MSSWWSQVNKGKDKDFFSSNKNNNNFNEVTISVIYTLLSIWLLWGVRCLKALLARVKFWWDSKPECLEKTLNVILRLTDIHSTRNNHRNGKNTWWQLCRPEGAQSGLFPDGHPSIHQPHLTGLNFGAQTGPFEATFYKLQNQGKPTSLLFHDQVKRGNALFFYVTNYFASITIIESFRF